MYTLQYAIRCGNFLLVLSNSKKTAASLIIKFNAIVNFIVVFFLYMSINDCTVYVHVHVIREL